ncbi:PaaI family thioesterase [Shewanella acanthi]|uniref:PaaI family thioesterase n=1 Tax=Shewanella acanthi TaxID=2864212 RepID=UPI001C658C01|nr:PaaI family thioesterase [Shewanella acanthi]QYJ77424.1 PaaI family thioesterase [Shewanella acanthi]
MKVENMNGVELLTAMIEGHLPAPSISETMPMQLIEVAVGYVKFSAKADARHLNPMGGVHGGFAATVLDSVLGCAVHSALEAGVGYGTVDLNIKMVRPIPQNTDLFAEGRLINLSRNLGIAEGSLKDAAGKLYAHGTTTCSIIRP